MTDNRSLITDDCLRKVSKSQFHRHQETNTVVLPVEWFLNSNFEYDRGNRDQQLNPPPKIDNTKAIEIRVLGDLTFIGCPVN